MKPTERVQHTAFLREAQLAAGLIGSGVTALGKATFAEVGYYHQAFFGLSIGLERLCKLLFMADHAIQTGGAFPTFEILKKQGHDLRVLLDVCENIATRVDASRMYSSRPISDVHKAVITVLTDFAKSTRYYNLDFLTQSAANHRDPIVAWWMDVGVPLCRLHYSAARRNRDAEDAVVVSSLFGERAFVVHTSETCDQISDLNSFMKQSRANLVVQTYGRLYVLQIVRWLGSIAFELSHAGGYTKQIAAICCFHEPFTIFCNENSMLKSRKTWNPYP